MRLIERRVGLLFAVSVLALGAILVRAVWIQAVRGGELRADARSQQTSKLALPAERGSILDRRGRELAVSEDAATIVATPYQLDDPAKTASELAEALDRPAEEILAAISDRSAGFAYIARDADLVAAERVRKLKIEGIGIVPDSRRVYPQGPLAAQLVGAVGTDEQGLYGLEAAREESLRGTDGEVDVTNDGLGAEIGRDTLRPESTGEDLTLTIDGRLQAGAEEVLAQVGERYSPLGATALLMDPRSGEILALANWPEADPTKAASESEESFRERGGAFVYEPGSTFKPFTVAGAISDGVVGSGTVLALPSTIDVADRTIEEATARGPVSLSVSQIIAQSSNVGAVKVGLELGATKFDRWVRKFGFGKPTGSGLPGEEQGLVPTPEEYSGSSMGNLPIGQGLSVTPVQMATGFAAIANDGVLPRAHIVRGEAAPARRGRRVLSRKVAGTMREMLAGVTAPGGTADEVSVPGHTVAGKTGTAQKAFEGAYSETAFVASFIGFAPAERPQLLGAVIVDEPGGGAYYGSEVAAPAFSQLMSFAMSRLDGRR